MKKAKEIFFMLIILVLILVVALKVIPAAIELNGHKTGILLKTGKNYLILNQSLYAKEIIILNPEIESLSYFDEFLNKSIGYVNVFGGVGSNFITNPEKAYEINVKEDINLRLLD